MKRRLRSAVRLLAVLVVGLVGVMAASWWAAGFLVASNNHAVAPALADLPVQTVNLQRANGPTVRGWLLRGKPAQGAVLLLHGVHADRSTMAGRARFLFALGYTVLAIDLQAHGETPGDTISFGYRESEDARTAMAFLKRKFPGERIGAIGVSMGGAAAVLADPPLPIDALVLEQVYPTAREAIEDRLVIQFGRYGDWLSPLLRWQIRPRLGIGEDALRPIDHVARLSVPKLILAAEEDRHTRLAESQALYAAAAAPKEWWPVPNAVHQDLHAMLGAVYESRIQQFFEATLRKHD